MPHAGRCVTKNASTTHGGEPGLSRPSCSTENRVDCRGARPLLHRPRPRRRGCRGRRRRGDASGATSVDSVHVAGGRPPRPPAWSTPLPPAPTRATTRWCGSSPSPPCVQVAWAAVALARPVAPGARRRARGQRRCRPRLGASAHPRAPVAGRPRGGRGRRHPGPPRRRPRRRRRTRRAGAAPAPRPPRPATGRPAQPHGARAAASPSSPWPCPAWPRRTTRRRSPGTATTATASPTAHAEADDERRPTPRPRRGRRGDRRRPIISLDDSRVTDDAAHRGPGRSSTTTDGGHGPVQRPGVRRRPPATCRSATRSPATSTTSTSATSPTASSSTRTASSRSCSPSTPDGTRTLASAMYILELRHDDGRRPRHRRRAHDLARPPEPVLGGRARSSAPPTPPATASGARSAATPPMLHVWMTEHPSAAPSPASRAATGRGASHHD